MPTAHSHPREPRWESRLRRLKRQQHRLVSTLARMEELAGRVEWDHEQLRVEIRAATGNGKPAAAQPPHPRRSRLRTQELRRLGDSGLSRLTIDRLPDGRFAILADERVEFELSPGLGLLLSILASRPEGEGELHSWKPLPALAQALGAETERSMSEHAVTQAISCLRQEFERAGLNPFLVQTHRRHGARLGWRAAALPSSSEVRG